MKFDLPLSRIAQSVHSGICTNNAPIKRKSALMPLAVVGLMISQPSIAQASDATAPLLAAHTSAFSLDNFLNNNNTVAHTDTLSATIRQNKRTSQFVEGGKGKRYDVTPASIGDGICDTSIPNDPDCDPSTDPDPEPQPDNPPTISGSPASSVIVGNEYSFLPTANDSDGDQLSFAVTNLPSWAQFSTATGRLWGTPSASDISNYSGITITVSANGKSDSISNFSIDVQAALSPVITSASYDFNSGTLVVSGSDFQSLSGASNDITANKFTVRGEAGATYTLTDTPNVEITSATQFTLILSATDKAAVDALLNKNGTASEDATPYNLSAQDDWNAAVTDGDIADVSNGVTVSNVPEGNTAPVFTSNPVTNATEDELYSYTLQAIDSDINNVVSFSVKPSTSLPSWLTLSEGSTQQNAIADVSSPGGIARDNEGNTYVAELFGTTIYKIAANGTKSTFATVNSSSKYGLLVSDGYLYISYYNVNKITRISLANPLVGEEDFINPISDPLAMIEKDGFIYVAQYSPGKVAKIEIATKQVSTYVENTSYPFGIGFDSKDNLFIASYNNRFISKFDGQNLVSNVISFNVPLSDIKVDANDNLYVSTDGSGVKKISADLTTTSNISTSGNVWGMTLSSEGVLSWGDYNAGKVYTLATGAVLSGIPENADIPVGVGQSITENVCLVASDGVAESADTEQCFDIQVTNINDPIVISSNGAGDSASVNVNEETTAVTQITFDDIDFNDTATFSLVVGDDSNKFDIDNVGNLSFKVAPDFEMPTDSNLDNSYVVTARVNDNHGSYDTQQITVNVQNVVEAAAPVIISNPVTTAMEDELYTYNLLATDANADAITLSVKPGTSLPSWLTLTSSNTQTTAIASGFNYPEGVAIDDNGNSYIAENGSPTIYKVTPDGSKSVFATVTNRTKYNLLVDGDYLYIAYTHPEHRITRVALNDGASGEETFINIQSPTGMVVKDGYLYVAQHFEDTIAKIDMSSKQVVDSWTVENPWGVDFHQDGTLFISHRSSNSSLSTLKNGIVTSGVVDLGNTVQNMGELRFNTSGKLFVSTDRGMKVVSADLSSVESIPNSQFSWGVAINPQGNMRWLGVYAGELYQYGTTATLSGTPSNDDIPVQPDNSKPFPVCFIASDGNLEDEQCFTINARNTNDAPIITSNGGGDTATISVAENATSVTRITYDSIDFGDTETLALVAGKDSDKFQLDNQGNLNFKVAPDFENPTDSDSNNIYLVDVRVHDAYTADVQQIAVNVTDVSENTAPRISGNPSTSVNEGSSYRFSPSAVDNENDNLTFRVSNLPSWASFSTASGVIFGTPNQDDVGSYLGIVISVTDGKLSNSLAPFTITVKNVNDAPEISGVPASKVSEGESYRFTPSASDKDGDTLTFSIANKPSWASFDAATGTLSGTPTQADVDKTYANIVISVSDGVATSNLNAFAITVANVNDAPVAESLFVSVNEKTATNITLSAADVDGDSLTFNVVQQPSNGTLSGSAPNLIYTPNTDFIGSDSFTFKANDGALDSNIATVALTIKDVNFAPKATDDAVSVVQNSQDNIISVLFNDSDPDGDSLNLVEVSATYGTVAISGNKLVYTPQENSLATDTITYVVSDGNGEHTSAQVTVTISEAINQAPVAVDDSVALVDTTTITVDVLANDSDPENDALTILAASSRFGELTIVDNKLVFTLSDSITGEFSGDYSIQDAAGNTASAKVFFSVTSEMAPQINLPADLCDASTVAATGLYTRVELGEASAIDSLGNPLPVSLVDGVTLFPPGINEVKWQAIDADGNSTVATQRVCVNPLITIEKDKTVVEGESQTISFFLNGDAPVYPVIIPYTVSGHADDHTLRSGNVMINQGTLGRIAFEVNSDHLNESDEVVTLSIDAGVNLGANTVHNLTITESNRAPVLSLTAQQASEQRLTFSQQDGVVRISAHVTDPDVNDEHSYLWHSDTEMFALSGHSDSSFEFEPATIAPGVYEITVIAIDSSNGSKQDSTSIVFDIVASLAPLASAQDSDGDLIPDSEEGHADSDSDGIPDYLDRINECNVIPELIEDQDSYLVEGESGVCLRKGKLATTSKTGGALLDINSQQTQGAQVLPADSEAANVGGIFDYIAYGLPQNGQSYALVLPQRKPIPEHAVFRKFRPEMGWGEFVLDQHNSLWSTQGEPGYCPPPSTASHNNVWVEGLNAGHWCVQQVIQDGGPNDNDGIANGTIVDPGGVAVFTGNNSLPVASDDVATTMLGQPVTIDVLANDSDADNDDLTITSATASIGEVTIFDRQLHYLPPQNYVGSVTIQYGITDGNNGTDHGTVLVTIENNQAPQISNEHSQMRQGESVSINLLANDVDSENETLTLIAVDHPKVSFNENGEARFTPDPSFYGEVAIGYQVQDTYGNVSNGQWTVVVTQVFEEVAETKGGGSLNWLTIALLGLLGVRRGTRNEK